MTQLLILGRSGQLAEALARRVGDQFDTVTSAGQAEANMATPGAVTELIASLRPDVVINAAAYTAVDKAEAEPDLAQRINAVAAGEAAATARDVDARFIHVSTDYVFGDEGDAPFTENATPAPINTYGRTKLAGEQAVAQAYPQAATVRTSAVFSGRGKDFPSAIWRKATAGETLKVVCDQWTCPTFADDLADRLLALAQIEDLSGVFHCTGTPGTTWHDFAEVALELLHQSGGPKAELSKVSAQDFETPATRPTDSRLASTRLEALARMPTPDWRRGLTCALDVWLASR